MTRTLASMATTLAERFVPVDRPVERIARCLLGLVLFGVGITLLIEAELGAAPWDVFHTGVTELTGISTGFVIIITGVLLLLLWIPLREQPGLGTILNAIGDRCRGRSDRSADSRTPTCSSSAPR